MLNVNQLANGLGFAFNTKSQNAQQWAQLIGDTIWAYTSVISPPSAGVASGKATFVGTFVNQSYGLQSYLPRALTAGLPPYAIQIAAGMFQFGYSGVPPSAPLPNFQGIMNSNRDSELTSAQCANKLAIAIHNWFATGIAINLATGVSTPWTAQVTAADVSGAGPPVPSFELSGAELATYETVAQDLKANGPNIIRNEGPDDEDDDLSSDDDENYGNVVISDEIDKQEGIVENKAKISVEVEYNEEEIDKLIEEQNPITKKAGTLGDRIAKIAFADVGMDESFGKNYGGKGGNPKANGSLPKKKNGRAFTDPGRIDEMLANAGLPKNYALVKAGRNLQADSDATDAEKGIDPPKGHGTGYSWCAAAVTTWWKEGGAAHPVYYRHSRKDGLGNKMDNLAGQRHPKTNVKYPRSKNWRPASCPSWKKFAKYHGLWLEATETPSVGYAILYSKKPGKKSPHHIGLVAGVRKDLKIVTIEGNTDGSPKPGDLEKLLNAPDVKEQKVVAEGNGCRVKVANAKTIDGFVKCVPVGSLFDLDPSSSTKDTIYRNIID